MKVPDEITVNIGTCTMVTSSGENGTTKLFLGGFHAKQYFDVNISTS